MNSFLIPFASSGHQSEPPDEGPDQVYIYLHLCVMSTNVVNPSKTKTDCFPPGLFMHTLQLSYLPFLDVSSLVKDSEKRDQNLSFCSLLPVSQLIIAAPSSHRS